MNMTIAPGLSPNTQLYKLLEKCSDDHGIELLECHDGAFIMKCFTCPFNWTLTDEEEKHVRAHIDERGDKLPF